MDLKVHGTLSRWGEALGRTAHTEPFMGLSGLAQLTNLIAALSLQLNFGFDGFVMHGNHVLIKRVLLLQSSFLFGTCPLLSLAFGLVFTSLSFQLITIVVMIIIINLTNTMVCSFCDYEFDNYIHICLQHLCFLWRLDITSKVYRQRSGMGMGMGMRMRLKKVMKRVKLLLQRKNM